MVRRDRYETEAVPSGAAFCLFDTAIGRCAALWRAGAIVRIFLPQAEEGELGRNLLAFAPDAEEAPPPPAVAAAVAAIQALLRGEAADFAEAPLDFGGAEEFERRVWQAAAAIPAGETRSYGEIAAQIGAPGAARAVGRALGRNPFPIIIPCHRVLAAGGGSGGFSAPGGASTKMRILGIENARRGEQPLLFERLPWALSRR